MRASDLGSEQVSVEREARREISRVHVDVVEARDHEGRQDQAQGRVQQAGDNRAFRPFAFACWSDAATSRYGPGMRAPGEAW